MTKLIKLKNQTIVLPKEWKGEKVFIKEYDDTIIIKRVEKPAFWGSWEKIKDFSKGISKKDIEKAVLLAKK